MPAIVLSSEPACCGQLSRTRTNDCVVDVYFILTANKAKGVDRLRLLVAEWFDLFSELNRHLLEFAP